MKKKLLSLIAAASLVFAVCLPQGAGAAAQKYADPATDAELEAASAIVTSQTINVELINGELYVWGSNGNGKLGITVTYDPDNNNAPVEVKIGDMVKWPTKIEKSVFGGQSVVKVIADYATVYAITEDGSLYGWGRNQFKCIDPDSNEATILTPVKNNFFNNYQVLDVSPAEGYNVAVQAKDRSTNEIAWYLWGRNAFGECGTGAVGAITTPTKFNAGTLIPGEEIEKMVCGTDAVALKTKSGKVYAFGKNISGQVGNNFGIESDEVATNLTKGRDQSNVLAPSLVNFGGKTIKDLTTTCRAFVATDTEGSVWTWGYSYGSQNNATDGRAGLGLGELGDYNIKGAQTITVIGKPMKVFGRDSVNPDTAAKKARKVFGGGDSVMVLCTDNTVYAWGLNNAYRIFDKAGKEKYTAGYPYPTQIMESVSKKDTIVTVTDQLNSFSARTRTGDSFLVGQDTDGTSTGTDAKPVVPETLPPVKPTTANKVYLDIVYPNRKDNGNLATVTGAAGTPTTAYVDAGQKFTVKVYFEDFARIDQFTLPIKFTTDRAQVVYKSGSGDEEYTKYAGDENEVRDQSNIISFGSNTGIQSNVRESVWSGGALTTNESYPRVNNQKGYVSVHGETTVNNAAIVGKQLMFSIDFVGTATGEVTFSIPSADNMATDGDPILAEEGFGAVWKIVRQLDVGAGLDAASFFEFNDDFAKFFPIVDVNFTMLKKIDLDLFFEKDGKQYNVEDTSEVAKSDNAEEKRKYYTVDKNNTDTTYVVKGLPDPTNASDADIESWNVEFDSFSGLNPSDKEVSDYINVVQTGKKTLVFNMPESTTTTTDGYFKITATKTGKTIAPIYLKVSSMVPPTAIKLRDADKSLPPFLVNDSKYTTTLGLNNEYTFEAQVDDSANTGNTNVTWTLYNCVENDDGTVTETVIANNDTTAPAVIKGTATDISSPLKKTARIAAQRTTPDNSYIKIKVASTAGATVYDEATFRVELLSTGIITGDKIFIGKNTSRPLAISADPYDAYKPEFEIQIADDSPAALSSHGSYISVSANGVISAGNEYYEGDQDIYDEVIIREKKSDAYFSGLDGGNKLTVRRVKIYVMNILPPPDMDVEAQNNVGVLNDKVIFNADLQEGDGLKIYKSFMDDTSLVAEFSALTKSDIVVLKEGYLFVDEDEPANSGLAGTGGTVGYLVTRAGESFTQVPVTYSAEPCMLTGYARLEGKMANSPQNEDIMVEIMGLRDADGNPIPAKTVQDETGYFEFENYVPVGSYTIKISRDLYLTRYITVTVTGTSDSSDIEVSTIDKPIYLAPGDLGNPKNGRVDPAEYQSYLMSWFGKSGGRGSDVRFSDYNFAEPKAGDNVIGMYDTSLLLRYYNRDNVYKDWVVTQ